MTDQPIKYDENTPPDDVRENIVDPDDDAVELAGNQDPEPDLDEEDN